ncbi:MAG TPA: YraN family protein [Vitreimonas sp.]|nr:YraN family protein [Vitreimonas sp.]
MDGPPSRTPAQRAGDAAEELVAQRLVAEGWTILARNVRVARRELDIVAIDAGPPPELVVVEVRWRRDRSFGLPEETVDWRKRRHVRMAALALLDRGLPGGAPLPTLPLRFDLVVVEPPPHPGGQPRMRHHRHLGR